MVVGCVRALRGLDSAVDVRSEEACGFLEQTGFLVASETTIRLRQATERGSAEIDGQVLRVLCVRYGTVGGEGDFVMRPHLRRRPQSESPGGDFGPRSSDWLVAPRRSIIRTEPLLIKHQGRRSSGPPPDSNRPPSWRSGGISGDSS